MMDPTKQPPMKPVWLRQALVNFIVWAWPVMPKRLRLWAFMNDGPLKGD